MLKIGIICSDVGWIYDQFLEKFNQYSKHDIIRNPSTLCDVYYYVPYYETPPKNKIMRPCCAWMSHQETKSPLKEKFISSAKQVDFAISHSKKYADLLTKHGVQNVKQIIPGVDLVLYKTRSTNRPSDTNKLIVGYSGRTYQSSNRKNPELIKKISSLQFVEFRATNGNIKSKDMPKFYSDCDVIVQPSLIEGGSMAIQESLAVGTPIMCFQDVGVAQEFTTGIIRVDPKDKVNNFLSRLEILWTTRGFEQYRHAGIMNQMRDQVMHQTWDVFARRHDSVWESLV